MSIAADNAEKVRRVSSATRARFDAGAPGFKVDARDPLKSLISVAMIEGSDMDDWRREFPPASREKLDLRGADLSRGVFLIGTERLLAGADPRGTRLDGSVISSANLKDADLTGATLRQSLFAPYDAAGASLKDADASHSFIVFRASRSDGPIDLTGADLSGSTLQLQEGSLENEKPPRVILTGAKTARMMIRLNFTPARASEAAAAVEMIDATLAVEQKSQITWIVEAPLWSALSAGHRQLLKRRKAGFGGCFVATAACESESAPEVGTLREFRDEVLAARWEGRLFIGLYETFSPPAARLLEKSRTGRMIVRALVVKPASLSLAH